MCRQETSIYSYMFMFCHCQSQSPVALADARTGNENEPMKRSRATAVIVLLLSSAVGFAQSHAQSALQTQNSSAQQLLTDSIEKLDVTGVRAALDKGANPNGVYGSCNSERGFSVIGQLAMAVPYENVEGAEKRGVEILEMLFKAGAKLQPCDQGILFSPVVNGSALFTEALLNNGVSPTREFDPGDGDTTPMEIAVEKGQTNIIKLLEKHGVPALEPRDAAQVMLIGAADDSDIPRMEDAIDNGADVNGRNRHGVTALIKACHSSSSLLAPDRYSAAVLYLLKKGADPTVQGSDGIGQTTALHSAIYMSSFLKQRQEKNERLKDARAQYRAVIEALLKHGALVSARDWDGQTPLHIAAKRNNVVGAQMLIDAGCKISPTDREGKTPLDYAESAEMIKLLRDHGAKEQ